MRDGSTMEREMHPPILLIECPEGHLWTRVNERWTADGRKGPIRWKQWCPDHFTEREACRAARIAAAKREADKRFADMPLPATRRCCNPEPTKHLPNAVLPSGRFYRVKGVFGDRLDSRCKECRREESANRRKLLSKEEARERQRRYRNKRKRERERLAKQDHDKRIPIGPFRDWITEFHRTTHLTYVEIAARADVDEATLRKVIDEEGRLYVQMAIVDKVGIAWETGLLDRLYPIDQAKAA